ncbi:MAG TPA: nitroreductase/quinone reductase family protein [Candidatus Saccharimonadales bacterium]|nr:nitroreductase/quinone reductase family protein [Candidatus Saccharimonadales bacterium]
MDKRRVTGALAKYAVNPIASRVAGRLPWFALLETRGRRTGRPRRTPVGDGLRGDVFWLISDHGEASAYVRNIRADPRVRVRTHGRWRSGVATVLGDDDPRARQGTLGLGANALFVRIVGTTLLTVRIDLDPAAQPDTTDRNR